VLREKALPYMLEHADYLEQQLERHDQGEPTVRLSLTDDVFLRSDTWARWQLGIPVARGPRRQSARHGGTVHLGPMRGVPDFPTASTPPRVAGGRDGTMKQLLCRMIGHQRTQMAFSTNRFSCRRCGAELGRDLPVMPTPPAAALTSPPPRISDRSPTSTRQQSLRSGKA
jgi:hypothetical protein